MMNWSSLYTAMICLFMANVGLVQAQTLILTPPPDTTVSANRNGCWAVITLDTAFVESDCGGMLTFITRTPFDTLNTNGGLTAFRLGTHEVEYVVRDECGQSDSATMFVTVEDTVAPVAICTGLKTVALGGEGMALIPAFTFDGGSIEFCFKYYKVRRLIPPTAFDCATDENPDYMLDDVVKFCCQDINDTVEVLLRVYDIDPGPGVVHDTVGTGHFSDCTARVVVQDKIAPRLVCPPDTTIECGAHIDLDSLGLPTYEDECDSIVFEVTIERDLDKCGTGEIRRVIIGTDEGGNTDTCIQRIIIIDSDPFDGLDSNDLMWPEPLVMIYDCNKHPDTSLSGAPKFVDDGCSLISVSWEDQDFSFSRDVCVKVIRTWKVIDWCQYDPKVDSRCYSANGCWTFEQIIKVIDTIPADIIEPVDTLVAYKGDKCEEIYVKLDSATADTCYFGEIITITHSVDLNSDGVIDRGAESPDASGLFAPGVHTIIFQAVDGCHNTSFDTTIVTVKDSTKPTPIAMNGISLSLTDMGGGLIMSQFNANLLNASSYDNCTAEEDLLFSFSRDVNDTIKIVDCDNVPSINIELWVTDQCGNQDFVIVPIVVGDPDDVCGVTNSMSEISGAVARLDGMKLGKVDIQLDNQGAIESGATDDQGDYIFRQIGNGNNYKVKPQKNNDFMEGVSTRDLILIQRHLLGKTPLEELDQLIAADVNESGHISAKDIAVLRTLILGGIDELPGGKSWTFIPTTFVFNDPKDPFASNWPEEYVVTNLLNSMRIDFMGIKLGDINRSFDGLKSNKTRGQEKVELSASYDEEIDQILFESNEDIWLEGLQLSMTMSDWIGDIKVESSVLEGWNESYYSYNQETKELKISYNIEDVVWVGEGVPLFQFSCGNNRTLPLIALDQGFSECYLADGQTQGIGLIGTFADQRIGNELNVSVEPNPFLMETKLTIYSDKEADADMSISGVAGHKIYSTQLHLKKGWNEVVLDDEIQRSGIYIITISNGYSPKSLRIVRTE